MIVAKKITEEAMGKTIGPAIKVLPIILGKDARTVEH